MEYEQFEEQQRIAAEQRLKDFPPRDIVFQHGCIYINNINQPGDGSSQGVTNVVSLKDAMITKAVDFTDGVMRIIVSFKVGCCPIKLILNF